MPNIGNITVPTITPSGTFPLTPDWGYVQALSPEVAVHQIGAGAGTAKREQRFLLGSGAKRWRIGFRALSEARRVSLRDFWETNQGAYGAFTFNAPSDDGQSTTPTTCRFEEPSISWEFFIDQGSTVGLVLAEIPSSSPTYTLGSTVTRFPSAGLATGLLPQVQELVPLVHIQVKRSGYPDNIFISDRQCTVGAQLYQARILGFDGISQGLGGESDLATFTLGNADRVMTLLANDVDLVRASIEFSLFHVGTGIKIDLWKGEITEWGADNGPVFTIRAADGLYELNLPYPPRRISRSCWKDFNDGLNCPAATEGGTNLTDICDKGFDTPKGCTYHSMKPRFGGIVAKPQAVRIKDNSTGTWGFGRSPITSSSLVADSIYDEVVPEIYCNVTDADTSKGLPVNAKIAAGRDESDFYVALGVVGEGPIGAFASQDVAANPMKLPHLLDGRGPHGSESNPKNNTFGLRTSLGPDPNAEPFSLGEGGSGPQTYGPERAAGTAFIEIRRTDPKGIQPSKLSEHAEQTSIRQGLSGFTWSAPGARSSAVLTNPVWIAVNMLLRARGLRGASAMEQEKYFDVSAAIAAAAICDTSVTKLVGAGTETQFRFSGIIQEQKPLRDWLTEVLMGCLGHYSFSFGKLRIGLRTNSSVTEAFTDGNILYGSLQLSPIHPSFNHLTANIADEEFEWVGNAVSLYDIDHAKEIGGAASPLFLKSTVNLSGVSTKSQALRVVRVRLAEEIGGINQAQRQYARQLSFKTTVLALNVDPGTVCSLNHPDLPTYPATDPGNPDAQAAQANFAEFRCIGWRLNGDYSIDITGRTTHNDIYEPAVGPKPADVVADPIPANPVLTLDVPTALTAEHIGFTDPGSDGSISAIIRCGYTPPVPIGLFKGVHFYVEAPDESGTLPAPLRPAFKPQDFGKIPYKAGEFAYLAVLAPQESQTWRVYFPSYGLDSDKSLVRASDSDPTPSVTLTVNPPAVVDGEEYAKVVTDFVVTLVYEGNSQFPRARTKAGARRWRIDVTWTNPALPPRSRQNSTFGGIDIDLEEYLENPGNREILASMSSTSTSYKSPWMEMPAKRREFFVWGVSYDSRGRRNSIRTGVTPRGVIVVDPPATDGNAGIENAPNVTNFAASPIRFVTEDSGQKHIEFDFTWTEPAADDPDFGGGYIWGFKTAGEYVRFTGLLRGTGTTMIRWTTIPQANDTWTMYWVSVNKGNEPNNPSLPGNYKASAPNGSPSVQITATPVPLGPAGQEYTSVITGFSVSTSYVTPAQGATQQLVINCLFTKTGDKTWAAIRLFVTRPNPTPPRARAVTTTSINLVPDRFTESPTESLITDLPTANETWTVKALSVDVNGKINTYLNGVTPEANITVGPPPQGTAGKEFCDNVTGFTVGTVVRRTNADGTSQDKLPLNWTKPGDVRFAGVDIIRRVTGQADKELDTGLSGTSTEVWVDVPGAAESWTIYAVAYDVNGQRNSYPVTGVTPNVSLTEGTASGIFDPTKSDTAKLNSTLGVTGGLFGVVDLGITTTKIADDSISTPKLQANSITAGKIAAAVVSSDKLDSTEIKVGGGGSRPGKFGVYDSGGVQIGFIGVESANVGAWFKTISVGGSSYATGQLKADASGNVTLAGSLLITAGAFTTTINAANALRVENSVNQLEVVSGVAISIIQKSTSAQRVLLSGDGLASLTLRDTNGNTRVELIEAGSDGYVAINGAQVIRTRKTGWGAWTGTATRTSKATSSATLQNVAEALKALLDDLIGHGLIGP